MVKSTKNRAYITQTAPNAWFPPLFTYLCLTVFCAQETNKEKKI